MQIIRKGKRTTRIKRPVDHGRAWAIEDEQIDTDLILDDGGQLWEQHSHNPKHASYLDSAGEPVARLQVQRVYKNVVKAKIYLGEHQWSEMEDVPPSSVHFDGGAAAGWNPPTHTYRTPPRLILATTTPPRTRPRHQRLPGSGCPISVSPVPNKT